MMLVYFIDGYNVVHHSPRLREAASRDFERARDLLIDLVARYCGAAGVEARIVFDGNAEHAKEDRPVQGMPGVHVIYARKKQTADAYIERTVYESASRRSIVVVTSDHGIRDLCGGLGALTMSPEHFLASAQEAATESSERMDRAAREGAITSLEDRLGASSLGALEALRSKLPES
ncbi:MAG: NYN domain-containing protein [Candidatus Hydrogenedentota bacterium]